MTAAPPAAPTRSQPRTPNQIALALTGRDYLSYSAIRTYQQCPLQYYFRYVAGRQPEFTPATLLLGVGIHAAIEAFYRNQLQGGREPHVSDLLDRFEAKWESEADRPIKFGKSESIESLRNLAERMLAAFLGSDGSKMDTTIIGVEQTTQLPIVSDCPDILGRLDLVHCAHSALRITDFKTSRSRWNQASLQEAAPQMLLYAQLAEPIAEELGCDRIEIEWIVLTKTRQPVVERYTPAPHAAQINRVNAMVQRVWRAIAAGHFYPSPAARNCASCPFWTACQHWEGCP